MFLLLIIAIIKTDITYTRDKPLSKMHHIVKVYPLAGLRQTDRHSTCVGGAGGRKMGSVRKSCANFNFTSCSSVTNQVRLCCAVCHKQQQQQFVCLFVASLSSVLPAYLSSRYACHGSCPNSPFLLLLLPPSLPVQIKWQLFLTQLVRSISCAYKQKWPINGFSSMLLRWAYVCVSVWLYWHCQRSHHLTAPAAAALVAAAAAVAVSVC